MSNRDEIPATGVYRFTDGIYHFVSQMEGEGFTLCGVSCYNHGGACMSYNAKLRPLSDMDCPACAQVVEDVKGALPS